MAKASGSIDLSSVYDASKRATNFLVADENGIMVADLSGDLNVTPSTATGRNVFIDSDSVNIREGQTVLTTISDNGLEVFDVNGSSVAIYGESSRTGYASDYHTEVLNDSFIINDGETPILTVTPDGTRTKTVPYRGAWLGYRSVKSLGPNSSLSRTYRRVVLVGTVFSMFLGADTGDETTWSFTVSSTPGSYFTKTYSFYIDSTTSASNTLTCSGVIYRRNSSNQVTHMMLTFVESRSSYNAPFYEFGRYDQVEIDVPELHFEGDIYISGFSTPVGTRHVGTTNEGNISNGGTRAVANVTVEPGIWILDCQCRFAANATGYRRLGVSSTSGNNTLDVQYGASGSGVTEIRYCRTYNNNGDSNVTLYLNATQNSGGSLAASDVIFWATKIV